MVKKQVPKAQEQKVSKEKITCKQCGKEITEGEFCNGECSKMFKDNEQAQRQISKERYEKEIIFFEREIKFKQDQIDSKNIVETRMVNIIPGQPAIIVDGYKDGCKPEFMIQNEIDQKNQQIKERKKHLEDIKKIEEENATKPT